MIDLYFGPVVNPQTLTSYLALPRCLIAVGSDGNIIWIEENIDTLALHETITLRGLADGEYTLVELNASAGEFLMPGLIDTHVHACQFPNLGIGGDCELPEWLLKYVFPTESKFENKAYAERAYNDVINRSIASGTTTSCYYGSLHLDATIILADIVHKKGQRAFVGKCNMDWNCPGYYIEKTPEASLQDTITLIKYIQGLSLSHTNEPLVHPIITPRFALSCSEQLLTDLGKLAASLPHVSIQTHISENRREVGDALRRFDAESYASIYDRFGLLRHNTILGHGVWLTEKEMELIAERGAGVAHCPTSNFYLSSGMAKVGLLLDHGIKVGLGTDVGGGYNPSILYTIQMASTASKMVSVQAGLDEQRRHHRRGHCKHRQHGRRGGRGGHGKHRHAHHRSDVSSDSDSDSGSDPEAEVEAEVERYRKHHHHKHGEHHEHDEHHTHDEHRRHHHHHGHRHHHRHGHHGHRPTTEGCFADQKLQVATLLYLATLGGAEVCCLQDRIGSFAVGKAFDALHVSLDDATGNPAVWGEGVDEHEKEREEENVRRWLERFLFGGDNRNVRRVFVQGVAIGGNDADAPLVSIERVG